MVPLLVRQGRAARDGASVPVVLVAGLAGLAGPLGGCGGAVALPLRAAEDGGSRGAACAECGRRRQRTSASSTSPSSSRSSLLAAGRWRSFRRSCRGRAGGSSTLAYRGREQRYDGVTHVGSRLLAHRVVRSLASPLSAHAKTILGLVEKKVPPRCRVRAQGQEHAADEVSAARPDPSAPCGSWAGGPRSALVRISPCGRGPLRRVCRREPVPSAPRGDARAGEPAMLHEQYPRRVVLRARGSDGGWVPLRGVVLQSSSTTWTGCRSASVSSPPKSPHLGRHAVRLASAEICGRCRRRRQDYRRLSPRPAARQAPSRTEHRRRRLVVGDEAHRARQSPVWTRAPHDPLAALHGCVAHRRPSDRAGLARRRCGGRASRKQVRQQPGPRSRWRRAGVGSAGHSAAAGWVRTGPAARPRLGRWCAGRWCRVCRRAAAAAPRRRPARASVPPTRAG